eukprot:TRINITY_DN29719_c0_g1_i1.p1 TRINITY_DN29719_c0_g1~~TRINITY_DN29719_c0_g1_i1.p1  ORF type:complete len:339 (-),score=61.87 TRINITY_DN29719_c0_g1_i1:67-1029(-)
MGGNCCRSRRFIGSSSALDVLKDSRRWSDLEGELQITLRGISGQELHLPALKTVAPFRELQEAIRNAWQMPTGCQRLILNDEIVIAKPEVPLGKVLGLPQGGEVELSCVRTSLPQAEQRAMDCKLLQAVAAGAYGEISEALAEGANPMGLGADESATAQDRNVPSPMLLALAAKDVPAMGLLRAAGAEEEDLAHKPALPRNANARSMIGRAFAARNLAAVVRCVGLGADLNTILRRGEGVADTDGGTPLHALCAQHELPGASAVVELLCRLKADINAGDREGDSPLAHARYFNAKDIHSVLQAHGAQVKGPYYRYSFRRG